MSDTPNDIAAQETGILARLTAALGTTLQVAPFPDDPEHFRMTHAVGAVLLAYHGSQYSPPEDVDVIVQQREPEWDVVLLIRNLRTHGGVYAVLESVRLALMGFPMPGCRKLYLVRDRFINQKDGVWNYAMTFATSTTVVETGDDPIDAVLAPLLKRITIADPAHGTLEVDADD